MFLEFSGYKCHPAAAKVTVGNINAVAGAWEFSAIAEQARKCRLRQSELLPLRCRTYFDYAD
jgi:hypothetical protein